MNTVKTSVAKPAMVIRLTIIKITNMLKKQSFRSKLFLYLFSIFIVFTIVILVFQYDREKEFRKEQLENTLDNITELSHRYIQRKNLVQSNDWRQLDSLKGLIPQSERITIIHPKGIVLYDSFVDDFKQMENHINRPEIQKSIYSDFGANIRESQTTGIRFYYYARSYTDYYVRVAVIYNIDVKNFLEVEKVFIFFTIIIFILIWIVLLAVTRKLGETITKMKDFVGKLHSGNKPNLNIEFPSDEFGIISRQIVDTYKDLNRTKDQLLVEKNKLFGHLHALNEGVAFFSNEKEKILANNHFIQYLNIISEHSSISAERIFNVNEFKPILSFIDEHSNVQNFINANNLPRFEMEIQKGERYFTLRCVVYADRSFEIMITDISRLEKRRIMKQQMTSNIAHELKTPVAAVMGYMETLMSNNLEPEKKRYFIEKAFKQSQRLNELIEDISVLNKIEESKEHFKFEKINLSEIIYDVSDQLHNRLDEHKIKLSIDLDPRIEVNGNRSLLFSVFLNLVDNAIKYAGKNIEIKISNYLDDSNYYYFSFRDTGIGVKEEHLPRIFERFYRIDSGRSRKTGGTGLGLAIVKNAIQFHQSEISVRNHPDGGLEFLFTLAK